VAAQNAERHDGGVDDDGDVTWCRANGAVNAAVRLNVECSAAIAMRVVQLWMCMAFNVMC
jgi:hypothetical protein